MFNFSDLEAFNHSMWGFAFTVFTAPFFACIVVPSTFCNCFDIRFSYYLALGYPAVGILVSGILLASSIDDETAMLKILFFPIISLSLMIWGIRSESESLLAMGTLAIAISLFWLCDFLIRTVRKRRAQGNCALLRVLKRMLVLAGPIIVLGLKLAGLWLLFLWAVTICGFLSLLDGLHETTQNAMAWKQPTRNRSSS